MGIPSTVIFFATLTALTIALFSTALTLAVMPDASMSATLVLGSLELNLFAGLAVGILAALATGLILGRADRAAESSAEGFWQLSSFLASGALFLLMGATVTLSMFEQRLLALLIAIDWWTIQSMAFGVVLFGVLIQAPTLMLFARPDRLTRRIG